MNQSFKPTPETHVPILVDMPTEEVDAEERRRPDIPPPSIWQRAVGVSHKATGRRAAVHALDHMTRQFRPWYPDEQRFGDRTEWHSFDDWNVDVTFSPAELERQAAAKKLEDEIASLSGRELKVFEAFCQDDDPRKALAKLDAIRESGFGLLSPKTETKPEEKKK